MVPVSIVIITKNEAGFIADCINIAKLITDDIVLVDNGSTDETLAIARMHGCRVYESSWKGYGANKNKGIILARYNWILSLDADEAPDMELVNALHQLSFNDERVVYDIKFKSYFGEKRVRFGSWGRDHHIRLFNRKFVKWTEPNVHETLILSKQIKKKRLDGYFHHHSVKNVYECNNKAVYYAKLSAEKYFQTGKKSTLINLYLSPIFVFIKTYILLLGFLDGKVGWHISAITFKNRWLKYHYLSYLENIDKKKPFLKSKFAVEY
jgi:glycosyltransferase involved in cell wall biosynthesis